MDIFLLIVYIMVLILQIYLLVSSIKKKTKECWLTLFLLELIPMFIAFMLANYYDNLPGRGFMPGFIYMGETLFSYGAAIIYGIILFISVFSFIVSKRKKI